MGRKAKLKRIRRIAQSMPDIAVKQRVGSVVDGHTLIEDGVNEVEGKEVDPKGQYHKRETINRPMNHERNMKRMYKQFGEKGISSYVQAVNEHIEEQKNKSIPQVVKLSDQL